MSDTHCHTCGTAFVAQGCGTGYANVTLHPGRRICYSCADAEQVAEVLADKRQPVFAYVAETAGVGHSDRTSRTVTTWTGGKLPLTITRWAEHNDYRSGGYGNAVDTRGRVWTFRAAVDNGSYIKLRPIKGA